MSLANRSAIAILKVLKNMILLLALFSQYIQSQDTSFGEINLIHFQRNLCKFNCFYVVNNCKHVNLIFLLNPNVLRPPHKISVFHDAKTFNVSLICAPIRLLHKS